MSDPRWGISAAEAAELARNHPGHLTVAFNNFKIIHATGKHFTRPAGWIAIQCQRRAAPVSPPQPTILAETEAERRRRQFREALEKRP